LYLELEARGNFGLFFFRCFVCGSTDLNDEAAV